jgi:hypothetical protein
MGLDMEIGMVENMKKGGKSRKTLEKTTQKKKKNDEEIDECVDGSDRVKERGRLDKYRIAQY